MRRDPADRGAAPTYREAGVDIEAKIRLLADLAPVITATQTDAVGTGFGAFAGALRVSPTDAGYLVATTDGVGTKALVARRLRRDRVVGADIVAHCANDLVAVGARPVAFLDYIAMARLDPTVVRALVEAMAGACRALRVVLLGGETAEMPGVYREDACDVVGTMIGLAPADGLITGSAIRPGDRLVGLASTGLHTNGYSLARRVLEQAGLSLDDSVQDLGATVGDALLAPHRCYAPAVLSLLSQGVVHGIAHITGGGLPDNLLRILPHRCRARLVPGWPQPAIFSWLQRVGGIPDEEMVRTFNLGIGMVVVVPPHDTQPVIRHFRSQDIPAFEIGAVGEGPRGVELA
ncbi:MAG: phosphoribosylformylglycinamidine cyclo-ligase [Armatimonadota bacterium]|nr:phosphoribosylformylglycinamidine cyclo-ligase [Armatimonadota bacterium]MDR7520060.1 phosphoribosylformylglycinamidine cyclo-ligase [Armatimonadota bacterium]MDR7551033.1 phosphoribosylformylglycinamidine cyclo-ligase [Armatimonadota bacterium]